MTFLFSALSAAVTASNNVVLPVPLGPSREIKSGTFIFHTAIKIIITTLTAFAAGHASKHFHK